MNACYFCKNELPAVINSQYMKYYVVGCNHCDTSNLEVRYTCHQDEIISITMFLFSSNEPNQLPYNYKITYRIKPNVTNISILSNMSQARTIDVSGQPFTPQNAWSKIKTILTFL